MLPEEVLRNPPSMGRLSELRALFLFSGQSLPSQPRVGLEDSGVVSWIVGSLRVGFRIPFDRRLPLSERLLSAC